MNNYISITIDKLDELDKSYSLKNRRKYNDIRSYIGNADVVFCYYAIEKWPNSFGFGTHQDVMFFILTNRSLFFPHIFPDQVWDINLNRIIKVEFPKKSFFGNQWVEIRYKTDTYSLSGKESVSQESQKCDVFYDCEDEELLIKIGGQIRTAIANRNNPVHSQVMKHPDPHSTQKESLVDQLGKLAKLRESGVLTEEEFKKAKERLLL